MSQNPNPEQYNQYSQQAPSYSQAPGQQPNGYVVSSKDDQNMAMLAHLASAILSLRPRIRKYSRAAGHVVHLQGQARLQLHEGIRPPRVQLQLLPVGHQHGFLAADYSDLGILGIILWVVPMVVAILMVIFHSLAALAANRGEQYTYPMTFIEIIK